MRLSTVDGFYGSPPWLMSDAVRQADGSARLDGVELESGHQLEPTERVDLLLRDLRTSATLGRQTHTALVGVDAGDTVTDLHNKRDCRVEFTVHFQWLPM